jgi:bifunctional UDP-N-acetylglucosamine pyrophosphorylase/glucosamine-1-phosphate N-acetyltransferase
MKTNLNYSKASIILGAGKGTRMKSSKPKVLHEVAGLPMIAHVMAACGDINPDHMVVVVGPDMDDLSQAVKPAKTVVQTEQLGTGHAALCAQTILKDFDGYVYVLLGDTPLIREDSLESLHHAAIETGLAVLGFEATDPTGYGRLIGDDDYIDAIVEDKDCDDNQRQVNLCNSGAFCVDGKRLFKWLSSIENKNKQAEYYLTDLVEVAKKDGVRCGYILADEDEVMGVNTRQHLATAEALMQDTLRYYAMDQGVTMIDPETVLLSADVEFGHDIVIEPNVYIGAGVRVGNNTRIRAFSYIEGTEIGKDCEIGPFARLRPKSSLGNKVTVGNFIEVNRSHLQDGAKSKHVSYLGDVTIGKKSNIGAGTVFANYDGFFKHDSRVGENVFIGSNSTIVSPITIGKDAIIAAGSTITDNVPTNAMGMARQKQMTKDGYAKTYRTLKQAEKDK